MAITGTGTEQDPFIVHSYDEIVEAFGCHNGTADMYYSKLATDIDCNDYGAGWEWESIIIANNGSTAAERTANTLDLDGHTIKNIYIKNGNMVFYKANGTVDYGCVKNGKILNVFGNSPTSFTNGITLENLSISLQFGTPSYNVFSNDKITNCAIYAIVMNLGSYPLISYSVVGTIKNLDLYCELYGLTGSSAAIFRSTSNTPIIDSVRCKGKLVSYTPSNPTKVSWVSTKAINSVFDVDMTSFVFPEGSTGTKLLLAAGDNTTVVNTSIMNGSGEPLFVLPNGYLQATSEQMTVGSELRGLGFLVVNVEE